MGAAIATAPPHTRALAATGAAIAALVLLASRRRASETADRARFSSTTGDDDVPRQRLVAAQEDGIEDA